MSKLQQFSKLPSSYDSLCALEVRGSRQMDNQQNAKTILNCVKIATFLLLYLINYFPLCFRSHRFQTNKQLTKRKQYGIVFSTIENNSSHSSSRRRVGGENDVMGSIVILAICKHHFIRLHVNLVIIYRFITGWVVLFLKLKFLQKKRNSTITL